ncbi:hypothetical protein IOQ59_13780 [Pontibacterium sp. N1Y112]|uniref:Uncharacterized protein n=1 Tax=Pontibacterium sinense TaxID=2781979 RepID=A0A8J7FC91_9GAMM|nr:hypothetical protein [Pontibacterium sinense]MBE9398327.1 hypothetical protein [Pontibacterium sinense]
MMIADLFDESDFREKLIDLGIPIDQDATFDECRSTVLAWLDSTPEAVSHVVGLFETLRNTDVVLLPEVDEFIENILSIHTR